MILSSSTKNLVLGLMNWTTATERKEFVRWKRKRKLRKHWLEDKKTKGYKPKKRSQRTR